jgi:hypothetical protein
MRISTQEKRFNKKEPFVVASIRTKSFYAVIIGKYVETLLKIDEQIVFSAMDVSHHQKHIPRHLIEDTARS